MKPIPTPAKKEGRVRRIFGKALVVSAAMWLPGQVAAQEQAAQLPPMSTEVTLRPGDALVITVWPNAELGGEFPIEETGVAYLPYLGSVQVAGVPLQDLRDRLRQGYATAVQNPVVTVTPLFNVSVLGEVRVPSNYQASPTNTFFDVIGLAGGFTQNADLERVRLIRGGEVMTLDALRAIEEGADLSFQLTSGDQIIVPTADPGFDWRILLTTVQTVLTLALLAERVANN